MTDRLAEWRGPMLPGWLVYALGGTLLATALATPWVVRWTGAFAEPVTQREGRALRPSMVLLPRGTFQMGSPPGEWRRDTDEAPHTVAVSPFWMCATEVTVSQYEAVTGHRPSDCSVGCKDAMPVQNVSWVDAVRYLNRLTELDNRARADGDRLTPCYEDDVRFVPGCTGYRLPSRAEWTYAAWAGSATWSRFGVEAALERHAWYADNAGGRVHLVDSKQQNAWGLSDIYGNVWEWVWVPHDPNDDRQESLSGATTFCGGAFDTAASLVGPSCADDVERPIRSGRIGFRCARDAQP